MVTSNSLFTVETYELDKLESKIVRQREHNERYRGALAAQDDLLRGIV